MTVTFRIIEGKQETLPYEELKHDYYHTKLLNSEIRKKYDLTQGQWKQFLRQLKEDDLPLKNKGGFNHKGYNNWLVKNYYYEKNHGKWKVQKCIHGEKTFFGYYDTEEEAQERVKSLRANRWDGTL